MVKRRRMLAAATVLALVSVSACATTPSQPDDESKTSIQSVIERAIDQRNHQVVAGFSSTREDISRDYASEAVDRVEGEYGQLHQRREELVTYGIGRTGSRSEISIKELTVSNDRAHAVVSEMTHLSHAPVGGVTGPDEVYVYEQKFELVSVGNGWKIATTGPTNPSPMPPSTVIDARSEAPPK